MITATELCTAWKISPNTLRTLLATVPKYRIGRQIRYRKQDIDNFLEKNKTTA